MKYLAALAFLIFLTTGARAHIGDDMTQLNQAYGATGKRVGNAVIFQKNGYSICVYFDQDHSAMEIFTRDGSVKSKTDISQDDIDAILASEGDGQTWSQVVSKSGKPTWLRSDHHLIARLSTGDADEDKVLMVMVNEK
jgi:hypothetical protein